MKRILLFGLAYLYFLAGDAQRATVLKGSLPEGLRFTENKGQWHQRILYYSEIPSGHVLLEKNNFYFFLFDPNDMAKVHHPGSKPGTILHGHAFKEIFEGANSDPAITGEKAYPDYANYYHGNDPHRWATGVKIYPQVRYKNLYQGIDLLVSTREQVQLKYDLVVHPGASVNAIDVKYEGIDKIEIVDGALHLATSLGDVIEQKPIAYQEINGERKEVKCNFILRNNHLGFEFPDGYNNSEALVIDPTLVFSTYTGSLADNWGYSATYDDQGDLYLGGYVNATFSNNTGYPTTTGAFQTTWSGGTGANQGNGNGIAYACDMGITKFTANGANLVYSTYLGGTDNETPNSLVVDAQGNLVVYGVSYSNDYPVTSGAFSGSYHGAGDIVVTKFNSTGTALVGSTFVGGSASDGINFDPTEFVTGNLKRNYGDQNRGEVQVDANGDIYVVSCTKSVDFPTSSGAFQTSNKGGQDGCVFKLKGDCSQLLYSSYIGGLNDDACYSCDLGPNGSLYVVGGTMSNDFPTTSGVIHSSYQGGLYDGFVTLVNSNGTQLTASTFAGTAGNDQVYCVKLDGSGNVYFMGQTTGQYPVQNANYSVANSGQFISKVNASLTTVSYSTVFGNGSGLPNISPTAFLVDTCENVYVAGWGDAQGSIFTYENPTLLNDMTNMPLTNDAFQSTTDGTDFYFFVMSRDAQSLLYGSYFGGNGAEEHVDGGTSRFDKRGVIYEAICAGCAGFGSANSLTPTTTGAWSQVNRSSNCNELGLKMSFDQSTPRVVVSAHPRATGCVPLTVQFNSVVSNASSIVWDFGDGSATTTVPSPVHTYNDTGSYIVTLIGHNNCNLYDTAFITVDVRDDSLHADFLPSLVVNCDSNFVSATALAYATTQYSWNMGDNTILTTPSIQHKYQNPGTYNIVLTLTDTTKCNLQESLSASVVIPPKASAAFTASGNRGCIPFTVNFNTQYVNTAQYKWTFGDGDSATTASATHTYTTADSFQVRLTVFDSTTCNLRDTAYTTVVTIDSFADASFYFSRMFYFCDSVQVMLWTTYRGEDSQLWVFSDGYQFTTDTVYHTFIGSNTFTIIHYLHDSRMVCRPDDTDEVAFSLNPLHISITIPDTGGCLPFTADFLGQSGLFTTDYYWFFGDGDSTHGDTVSHIYQQVGTYSVKVIAVDTNACQSLDSAMAIVTVIDDSVHAQFQLNVLNDCDSNLVINLVNQSTNALQYLWTFGDATSSTQQDENHSYHLPGTYQVQLIVVDTNRCHPRDTIAQSVSMLPNAVVDFTDTNVCVGTAIQFNNLSSPTARYDWFFADGGISHQYSPSHLYTHANTYTVTLVIIDSTTCNVRDTAIHTLQVYEQPIAGMLLTTDTFKYEVPVDFKGNCIYYEHLLWTFGDGDTALDEMNPTHTYESLGVKKVCIEAWNPECADTACNNIFIDFIPLIGVPNAFSPNGDGVNDFVKVEGKGIVELTFRIFNRWGEKVYETHDIHEGWDGVYKGVLQEMDVFTYAVDATFINGKTVALKGNITLLK